ncbi:MAG: hypothetical protein KBD66_01260 [Candidatus Doudnabacteria bacterium]|nr:hypothetical protein [Candidatus Doudnabacteria bacterium]
MKTLHTLSLCGLLVLTFGLIPHAPTPLVAQAAVTHWQQGVSMTPQSPEDFGSERYKQSIQHLQATGANYLTLVIPYYQFTQYDPAMGPGWNTPSDNSLKAGIKYAHEHGLQVMLKPHLEAYDASWRAFINTSDREGWFRTYGAMLRHYAGIAQEAGVAQFCIGTELINMASDFANLSNSTQWKALIHSLRTIYHGSLTYSANSDPSADWNNEKKYIGFWSELDMAGISAYYGLPRNGSGSTLTTAWDTIRQSDIEPFAYAVNKPLLFTEIGYRSVDGALTQPWNYNLSGQPDEQEQADAYEAVFSYWNEYEYIAGIHWWDWEPNPDAGGTGNINYTPQHKRAEAVLTNWFSNTPTTPPAANAFNITANPPAIINTNQTTVIPVTVSNDGGTASELIIDLEVYDANNGKKAQQFYEHQQLGTGERKTFGLAFTPTEAGTYTIRGGIFSSTWNTTYYWQNQAANMTAHAESTPPEDNPSRSIELWWPLNDGTVSGTQPFKALLSNTALSDYRLYWQVDNGTLNELYNSDTDYPHKEAWVDLSGWFWNGAGPYHIRFVATDHANQHISEKEINLFIAR